jgi:hypothetical protein
MHRNLAPFIESEQRSIPELERLINELLGRLRSGLIIAGQLGTAVSGPKPADDYLDIMLAEPLEAKALPGGNDFSIRPDLRVTVPRCPFRNVGVEPFPIFDQWRQHQERPAFSQLAP